MRPLQIELEGFLSHQGPTTVNLADLSAVAIVGENGSGKSSLVEAITWALYARGRGRGPDDFVHSGATRCRVRVDFELDGQRYAVERQRERGAGGKSYLGLFAKTDEWRPVGGDSIALTQTAIEDLLGMNGDLWEATAFIGQGKADAFTQLKPAARKQLLADLLELDRYADWADQARGLSREAAGILTGIAGQLDGLGDVPTNLAAAAEIVSTLETARAAGDEQIAQLSSQLASDQERLKEAELARGSVESLARELDGIYRTRQLALADIQVRLQSLQTDLAAAEASERIARADVERTRIVGEQLPGQEAKAAEIAARVLRTQEAIASLAEQHAEGRLEYERIDAERGSLNIHEVVERIRHLQKGESGKCFTCGSTLTAEQRAFLIAALNEERARIDARDLELQRASGDRVRVNADLHAELETSKRQLSDLHAELTAANDAVTLAGAQVEERPVREERLSAAWERLKAAELAVVEIAAQKITMSEPGPRELELTDQLSVIWNDAGAFDELKREVVELGTELVLARDHQAQVLAQLGAATSEHRRIAEQVNEVDVLERDRERYLRIRGELDVIAEAYGRDGIPTLIIETAIPALEEEANRLLHKITGGRFTLRIDSLRALKGGGMKESLEVIVADDVSERPLEALSGGERQCVDLSLRISLARLLAHRAGRPIETLIIDEGFTALDVVHRQRTIEVLHELLEEFTCVLFVTHLQELADAFPARLEITRDEDGSHVSSSGVLEAATV